jgi:hypothetical protein
MSEEEKKKEEYKEYEENAKIIINRIIEIMDEIGNEEDRIRIYGLITNTIIGEIEIKKLKNKKEEIIKMRSDSMIIMFEIMKKENIHKLLK